ncbi:MAG: hypothetical protein MJZ26_09115 [Fibrobacter sp.]|nr:hypothetical protein [Fibrobacter sp.]
MIKSEEQIELFIFEALKDFLEDTITGKVYRSECRPLDSTGEDAVISVSAADAEQIQRGMAKVNIYVNDTDNGTGSLVPSKGKTTALSTMDAYIVEILNSKDAEYNWRLEKATRTMKSQYGNQHFVSVSLEFKRTTF